MPEARGKKKRGEEGCGMEGGTGKNLVAGVISRRGAKQ
jgi:hypothetical protein